MLNSTFIDYLLINVEAGSTVNLFYMLVKLFENPIR